MVSAGASSASAVIRNATCPASGSPVQVPIQRSSRCGSVTAAHTSSIGASSSRSMISRRTPSRVSIRPVG